MWLLTLIFNQVMGSKLLKEDGKETCELGRLWVNFALICNNLWVIISQNLRRRIKLERPNLWDITKICDSKFCSYAITHPRSPVKIEEIH